MKYFFATMTGAVFGVMLGFLLAGVIVFISQMPHGTAITLQPPPSPAPIRVQISGQITQPGIYALPKGSRIGDIIQAAGGLLPDASIRSINQAAILEDGVQVIIPSSAKPGEPTQSSNNDQKGNNKLVNINDASQEELDALPNIGPVSAQKIIEYRTTKGMFTKIEDILNVPGIGQVTFEKIKELITISP